MGRYLHRFMLASLVALLCALIPTPAHADVGSTIVGRIWDSFTSTTRDRMQKNAPNTVRSLQEAEKLFLGQTEDMTAHSAIRDVFNGMRVVGLVLLGLCTIISLAQMAEAGMVGQSMDFTEWIQRFCVATFMTMGGIHFYGLWIRIFNGMLTVFRDYLDTRWTSTNDTGSMFLKLVATVDPANSLLLTVFGTIMLVVLFVLWFLIGGIRTAEMAISVIIAPLVWPVYLIPTIDDIPKSAFRNFLGLNAVLLIIVGMLRLSVRMVAGGTVVNTVWNWVPAIAMLLLTVFLPSMIKRLVGQGNTGAGGLMSLVYMAAGMKGIAMASGAGARAVSPPAAATVPTAPSGASAYPVAPLMSSGVTAGRSGASQAPSMPEVWVDIPAALSAGGASGSHALEPPFVPQAGQPVEIVMGQSKPGSNRFDTMEAMMALDKGLRGRHPIKDITHLKDFDPHKIRREDEC